MFTDRINVRQGNQRRRKALQRAAAKAQAIAALGQRAGGGLGRARFQSRLGFLSPGIARLGQGNSQFNIDDPFGQVETIPGDYDPAASAAGGGAEETGINSTVGPPQQPQPWGGYNADGSVRSDVEPMPYTPQDLVSSGAIQNIIGGGQAPAGYVWYQGRLIPSGVYRALQAEL